MEPHSAKAKALEKDVVKSFDKVSEAVKGVQVIHLTLKDDATVDEVLQKASNGFSPGVTIYDHTTTSVEGAQKRTKDWKAKGITCLHAPIFMGPPNALESTGFMLISSDPAVLESAKPELSKMTGRLIDLGAETGKATGMKLTGNLFLLSLTAGISDTLAFSKGLGISSAELLQLFADWNPAAAMPARLKKISSGKFDQPSWELDMARRMLT